MHNKDILWKGLLEWVFDDLLRFVFPDANKLFDWQEPVVYMDKELATLVPGSEDEVTARVVDKLAKVQLKKKKPAALVHIEVVRLVSRLFNCLFPARGHPNLSFCRQ